MARAHTACRDRIPDTAAQPGGADAWPAPARHNGGGRASRNRIWATGWGVPPEGSAMYRPNTDRSRLSWPSRILVAVGLASTMLAGLALSVEAEKTGPCTASINGVDIAGVSSANQ